MARWPGVIPAGVATGGFTAMEDWIPTIMSMLGFLATLHEFPPRMRSFGLDVDELLNQLNPARHR
ncbi:hypothetical protein [Mycobacterium ostraviense]|uniref:hypothetical protein n=1 Tax=Mycobacterium ostraviense TaxID=2738409 RepID=UPI0011561820|nr:hypothetical protein [Mycobacterium ostraviense]UGT93363.1 hypothetical protein LTS72_08845 [Mycobacterium ostraviense]